jgi:DNA-binding GntR family transcriptional regulator
MPRHDLPELIFSGDWPPSMMLEIFQVRMMIEPEAARIVAENRTPEDLRKIGESVAQMGAIIESGRDDMESLLSKWNRIFHAQIMAATGNQFLCRIYETVSRPTRREHITDLSAEELRFDEIFGEHRHILDAIRERTAKGRRTCAPPTFRPRWNGLRKAL